MTYFNPNSALYAYTLKFYHILTHYFFLVYFWHDFENVWEVLYNCLTLCVWKVLYTYKLVLLSLHRRSPQSPDMVVSISQSHGLHPSHHPCCGLSSPPGSSCNQHLLSSGSRTRGSTLPTWPLDTLLNLLPSAQEVQSLGKLCDSDEVHLHLTAPSRCCEQVSLVSIVQRNVIVLSQICSFIDHHNGTQSIMFFKLL